MKVGVGLLIPNVPLTTFIFNALMSCRESVPV